MRVRKIKGALDILNQDEKYIVKNPVSYKGKWRSLFGNNTNPLNLEIGCGKGKFITEMAKKNPNINYIGIEKVDSVLIRALQLAQTEDIPNLRFVLFDAANIKELFCDLEIDLIFLNFSDPWIKNRQSKRRLTAPSFLRDYEDVLSTDGEIYQKTDNRILFAYSIEIFNHEGWILNNISLDLHKDDYDNITTEFEEKWSLLGPIYRLEAKKPRR